MDAATRPDVQPVTARLISNASSERWAPAPRLGKSRRDLRDRCKSSWISEVFALILSVAYAVVTSVILQAYDGKPNPSLRFGLTPNALISGIATTAKVPLIYAISNSLGQLKWVLFLRHDGRSLPDAVVHNNASRGPLGSLVCLAGAVFVRVTVRARHKATAPLWKSSINPSLYHGIDFDQSSWRPLTLIAEMDAQAELTSVNLAPVELQQTLILKNSE